MLSVALCLLLTLNISHCQESSFGNHYRGNCHQTFSKFKSFSRGDLTLSIQNNTFSLFFFLIDIGFRIFYRSPTPTPFWHFLYIIFLFIHQFQYIFIVQHLPSPNCALKEFTVSQRREFHYKNGKDNNGLSTDASSEKEHLTISQREQEFCQKYMIYQLKSR